MAEIRLEHLTKRFGSLVAVDDLDLTMPDGAFVALLGPSGCGKTTTMNMISGLERPTGGEIYFDDRPISRVDPGRRNVGFVFQNYAIFTHMRVYENLAFGLRVRKPKPSKEEIDREVRRVAEIVGVQSALERNAGRLSVNDMQKVALGRSMIVQPAIFLLDEPFSNLDAAFRAYMRAELKRIQSEVGQTMVYVTHDQVEAMSMADRVVLLNKGRIEQNGTPAELYETPANVFVARFIGTPPMNLLRLAAGRAGAVVAGTDGPALLPNDHADGTLGIRPEHIALAFEEGLRAGVIHVEYLGADSLVTCSAGGQSLQARVAGRTGLKSGDATWLHWPRGAESWFDKSGARVAIGETRAATMVA
ncbi:MAG TPA: ABC transporter ATP-binding protein [Casimicrobiaceae bacterium]|nr:ABC transporter ATP-binding protein [Casimicrobiaceae bacterium]